MRQYRIPSKMLTYLLQRIDNESTYSGRGLFYNVRNVPRNEQSPCSPGEEWTMCTVLSNSVVANTIPKIGLYNVKFQCHACVESIRDGQYNPSRTNGWLYALELNSPLSNVPFKRIRSSHGWKDQTDSFKYPLKYSVMVSIVDHDHERGRTMTTWLSLWHADIMT